MKKIGIALGAGGAKGLAHLPLLDVLDNHGMRPHHLTGASVGAVVGALYASGMTAAEIIEGFDELFRLPRIGLSDLLSGKKTMRITDLLDPGFGRGGLLKGEKFSEFLEKKLKVNTFEELEIPLTICAADFWQRRQVVFDSGELMPALTASMALPGLISPVKVNGRVLVDGAAVNPLPYDLLPGDCDFIIAIDVMGRRLGEDDELPSLSETIFNTYQIMQRAILEEKLKQRSPDLLLEVDLSGIRTLDFVRAKKIYEQAASAREKLDQACRCLLD